MERRGGRSSRKTEGKRGRQGEREKKDTPPPQKKKTTRENRRKRDRQKERDIS